MDLRIRLLLITSVALIAAAVWTFPSWRGYLQDAGGYEVFPGLELDLQDEFLALSAAERGELLELHEENAAMALEMARIAVGEAEAAPAYEQDIKKCLRLMMSQESTRHPDEFLSAAAVKP